MKRIQKSALVPYAPEKMFDLVNDIESYPKFLPWCKSAKITAHSDEKLTASITMGGAGLKKSFTTQNTLKASESIDMRLVEGPFSHLHGQWTFHALGDSGCKISLNMEFEISNKLLRLSLEPVFTKIVNTLVDAFVQRANTLYGKA